jgi:hypothetical protein
MIGNPQVKMDAYKPGDHKCASADGRRRQQAITSRYPQGIVLNMDADQ